LTVAGSGVLTGALEATAVGSADALAWALARMAKAPAMTMEKRMLTGLVNYTIKAVVKRARVDTRVLIMQRE
jgi:hypothetical protein